MALYDPNEFPAEVVPAKVIPAEISPDISLIEFLAWARTKPASEPYDYLNDEMCAVGQFGRETGRPYLIGIGRLAAFNAVVDDLVQGRGFREDWTFGALAERIEVELAK